MNKIYPFTEAGKKNCILCCHVSSPHYHCGPILIKSSVTGSAVGNTKAAQIILSRDIQLPVLCPKCKDQSFRLIFMLFCTNRLDLSGNIFQGKNLLSLRFQSQLPGMRPKGFSEIHARYPRHSRIIIHRIGSCDLTARCKVFIDPYGI